MSEESKPKLEYYTKGKAIGTGSFGAVYIYSLKDEHTHRNMPNKMAVKVIGDDAPAEDMEKKLRKLRHRNLVSVFGLESAESSVFIKMELATCDLDFFRKEVMRGSVDPVELRHLTLQMAIGLEYLHFHTFYTYGNLKPANVLVFYYGDISSKINSLNGISLKISDFNTDFSREIFVDTEAGPYWRSLMELSREADTPYVAPDLEHALGDQYRLHQADIFSLGVVIFELLSNRLPFCRRELTGITPRKINTTGLSGKVTTEFWIPLLSEMLAWKCDDRPKIFSIIKCLRRFQAKENNKWARLDEYPRDEDESDEELEERRFPKTMADLLHRYDYPATQAEISEHTRGNGMFMPGLHHAAEEGNLAEVMWLCESGANLAELDNYRGMTPLETACSKGHLSVVKYLLWRSGGDVDQTAKHSTPLVFACEGGNWETVRYLLNRGASANVGFGLPLLRAAMSDSYVIVLHLAKIMDVNIQDEHGNTCLHKVCEAGEVRAAELLLDQSARSLKNKEGKTPLDLVPDEKSQEFIDLFTRKDQLNRLFHR